MPKSQKIKVKASSLVLGETDRQTNKQTDIPGLLQFLSTGSKLLVEAHLEGGIVGVDLGQAGAQGARGLRLLLQAGVKVVVVALQRREGHLEVLPLLQQEMNPEGCNIYVTVPGESPARCVFAVTRN